MVGPSRGRKRENPAMVKSLRRTALLLGLLLVIAVPARAQWTWTPQTGRWVNMKRLPKETPELQIEHARSLLVAGYYKKALAETRKFTNFYGDSDLADENQFLRGEIRMAQGQQMDAAKEFQQVLSAYPDTHLYDAAIARQYEIGDSLYEAGQKKQRKRWAFYKKRPLKRAAEVYGMVVENQPFTAAAAEAQYKIGLSHYARKEYVNAAFEYQRVVEDYPGSDWVDEASYGLAMCYYKRTRPAAYDQGPSQRVIDAVDTFAIRFPNDERVAELKKKRGEMVERIARQRLQTARFYEKRRLFRSARIYYELIVEQFDGTQAAQTAQSWLDGRPADEPSARQQVIPIKAAS